MIATSSTSEITSKTRLYLVSMAWPRDSTAQSPLCMEAAIQRCLSELPEEFRAVVVMVDIEGCNYQEVSEAIRKPIGTVKSRMARARLRLKECLKHFWELLPLKIRLESEA